MKNFFTSESVTQGHPDKVCDSVADAVLDEFLKGDSDSRVACEVVATTDYMLVTGEITSKAKVDVQSVARKVISDIGYNDKKAGFSADTVRIDVRLNSQSADIALGVDNSFETKEAGGEDVYDKTGAGDAYCAGVLTGIFHGLSDGEILRRGRLAAVGALSASGATAGVRGLAALEALYGRFES